MSTKTIRLTPQQAHMVSDILQTHLPGREVWVFGSRVGDHPKPYSDLDLVVQGDAPLPAAILSALKEAFEESDLPFQVDIVEWASTSEKFRQIIAANYLTIQRGRK